MKKIDRDFVIKMIRQKSWERWLQRPFGALICSFFAEGAQKEYFSRIGAKNAEFEYMVVAKGSWYISTQIDDFAKSLMPYAKTHDVFDLTARLNKFVDASRRTIARLVKSDIPLENKLAEIKKILAQATAYIWMSHGLEVLYDQRCRREVPKYIKGDVDKFIGDASLPRKKNVFNLMEDLIRRGVEPKTIVKKYGWLRCRDAYSEPYTLADIIKMKTQQKPARPHRYPPIPRPLRKLFSELRELVWYRTARTDAFFELLFLARPILLAAADKYKIRKQEIGLYPVDSLISGRPRRYSPDFIFLYYRGQAVYSNRPLLRFGSKEKRGQVKGQVAFAGKVSGKAKVVTAVSQLGKVKRGDILVTQMTFPNFIAAMQRAAAFVTDEGGITCHAAIVAREMKKPCVTGTKTATRVFKDGDMLEVDADKGIVKKIK